MAKRKPIYVESFIEGSIDRIWELTQDPDLHQRWDVRFGEISYLPKADGEPQRFVYATEPVPGLRVDGRGESIGDRDRPDGSRYSGLKFWSEHPLSIVQEGAGYWRYIPAEGGVRFLTRFDYRPRWGRFGELIDRLIFRPLFGWGTAWSFDRLRLWVEDGTPPETAKNLAIVKGLAVGSLSGAWIYHGLVPKLLAPSAGELQLLRAAGITVGSRPILAIMGLGEMAFGVVMGVNHDKRWPFLANLAALGPLAFGALRADRKAFVRPFNPISLNGLMMALAAIVLVAQRSELPSGSAPLREPPHLDGDVGVDVDVDGDETGNDL